MSTVRSRNHLRAVVLGAAIAIAAPAAQGMAQAPEFTAFWPVPPVAARSSPTVEQPIIIPASINAEDDPPGPRGSAIGLNPRLVNLLGQVERHFGKPVIITSGCRSAADNRRAGGARQSYHLRCMAADIKVAGVSESQVLTYVRKLPGRGGVGTYCRNSIVHIDVGPRREWHEGCGGGRKIARKKTRTLRNTFARAG